MKIQELLVTVVKQKATPMFTASGKDMDTEAPAWSRGKVMTLEAAMSTPHATPALFQYVGAPVEDADGGQAPRRGVAWAYNVHSPEGLPMRLLSLDLDYGGETKVPWSEKQDTAEGAAFIETGMAICKLLGAGYAFSKTGMRIFVVPGQDITSVTYSAYYRALLNYVSSELGIAQAGPGPHLDSAVCDFGRLFTCPLSAGVDLPETVAGLPLWSLDVTPCTWRMPDEALEGAIKNARTVGAPRLTRAVMTGDRPSVDAVKPDFRPIGRFEYRDEKNGAPPNEGRFFESWQELKDVLKTGVFGGPGDRNNRMMYTAGAISIAVTTPLSALRLWNIMAPSVLRSAASDTRKQEELLDELWGFCHGAETIRNEWEKGQMEHSELQAEQAAAPAPAPAPAQTRSAEYSAVTFDTDGINPEHYIINYGTKRSCWHGADKGYTPLIGGQLKGDTWRDLERENRPGAVQLTVTTESSTGRKKTRKKNTDELACHYTTTATALQYSANTAHPGGKYEDGTLTLPCWKLNKDLSPRRHMVVENWLLAMCGDDAQLFSNLQEWLARAVDTDRILGALYIVGPKGCGKSLFGQGLSQVWGSKPVPYARVLTDFQPSSALLTPVLFADEGVMSLGNMSADQQGKAFRSAVFDDSHTHNEKHVAAVNLLGQRRVVISSNNDSALQFGFDLTDHDIKAVVERVSYIVVSDEASDKARAIIHAFTNSVNPSRYEEGDKLMKLVMIPEYVLWCNKNIEQVNQRFGSWESGATRRIVKRMGAADPATNTVCAAILKNRNLDAASDPNQPVFYRPATNQREAEWCVRNGELSSQWNSLFMPGANPAKLPKQSRLKEAMRHITHGEQELLKVQGTVVRAARLNTAALVEFMTSPDYSGDLPPSDIWLSLGGHLINASE